jgi:hypothetical protein
MELRIPIRLSTRVPVHEHDGRTSIQYMLVLTTAHGFSLVAINHPQYHRANEFFLEKHFTCYRWLSFAISWRLDYRRSGLPNYSFPTARCFAEDVVMTKDGLLLRYRIYILTSSEFADELQMGMSIDSWGVMDLRLLLPVPFEVLQQLYFRHNSIDSSAFLRLDWILDEHSENVSLPERPWRDLDNEALRKVYTAQRNFERETEAFGLGELGASPFGDQDQQRTH